MNQPGRIGIHDVDGSLQCIRHVHHIHECSGGDRADEFLTLDCGIVDLHCIVCRTSSREGYVGNQAGEADGTCVDTVFVEIIVAEEFSGNLGTTVHRARSLDRVLGSVLVGSLRTEGTD